MKRRIKQVWRDPVLSKVISAGILGIISLIYNFINSKIDNTTFRDEFIKFWTLKVQLWHLIFLSAFALIVFLLTKKLGKFKYDDETLRLDRNFFSRIRETLLTEEMMLVPKRNGFSSNPFLEESLHKILDVCEESQKPSFAFINPVLNKKKTEVIDAINKLDEVMRNYIFGTHNPDWLSIPREWIHNNRELFDEAKKNISIQENLLTEKYDDLITTGIRILKI